MINKSKAPFIYYSGIIPTIVNLKLVPDRAAWSQVPGNLYIGRRCLGLNEESIWANPYKIDNCTTREESVTKYKTMLLSNEKLLNALPNLCFCKLGCWCAPDLCHGHILIEQIKNMLLLDIEYI